MAAVNTTSSPARFSGATDKLKLGAVHDPQLHVEAQFNPAQVSVARQVPWTKHTATAQDSNDTGAYVLEYTGAEPRTMQLELLFDGYEQGIPVTAQLEALDQMARPCDPESRDGVDRAPYACVVTWGNRQRPFRCVIASLDIKYTMFARDGAPLRATASITLKEADVIGRGTGKDFVVSERNDFGRPSGQSRTSPAPRASRR